LREASYYMKLYEDLAKYWPIFSPPGDYDGEARVIGGLLEKAVEGPLREVLELGCGGGNLASHFPGAWKLTLTDLSPGMLAHSRTLNPSADRCEGDMRTLRLDRRFDGIIVHDAVMYMTTEADLRKALETAFVHCRPGGAAIIAPDYVTETFEEKSDLGGEDGPDARMRWMEWTFDPDPTDTSYEVHYTGLVREAGSVRPFYDLHIEGLFPRATWQEVVRSIGFIPEIVVDEWRRELIVARKPS
jgi:SAM-dependent methyltransferase